MATKKDEPNVADAQVSDQAVQMGESDAGIDIQKYLGKHPAAVAIAEMFKVLFRDQIKTEAEWEQETNNILNRKV